MPYFLIFQYKSSCTFFQIISSFRNSHCYNLNIRTCNFIKNCFLIIQSPVKFYQRTDKPSLVVTISTTYSQRIFSLLMFKGSIQAFILWQNHCPANTPVVLIRILFKQQICKKLQMCAMKVSYSEMKDASLYISTIVIKCFNI